MKKRHFCAIALHLCFVIEKAPLLRGLIAHVKLPLSRFTVLVYQSSGYHHTFWPISKQTCSITAEICAGEKLERAQERTQDTEGSNKELFRAQGLRKRTIVLIFSW
ncbi:hypothetical protein CEXT_489311 [Caerostris extrusa]|uniref:Secreted protein n=1 Tax=Caerostris extrusa TaxID=172846 RepID=A0AAV4MNR6_CAEEX|nr:hypothetical protein CEXT_489311 [Caerostris extrusa]